MAGVRNCNGGRVAGVETINADCSCVGIESITQSSDLTRIYINLTNGTTDTFTLPGGATGPQGPAGATGTAGASGTSLIFSGPIVGGIIADVPTTTSGSYQVLSSFSTDHTNAAKNLVNVGDTIKIYSLFDCTSNPTATGIGVVLRLNGVGFSNTLLNEITVVKASQSQIELITEVVLKDKTPGAMFFRINSYINIGENLLPISIPQIFKIPIQDIGGATVDFSANNYTFSAEANSIASGDISLQLYSAEKLTVI